MMNKVFRNQIRDMLKVYMDEMIVKFRVDTDMPPISGKSLLKQDNVE